MADNPSILGELDAANLENQGWLGPSDSIGSRRIHKRLLNRSSSEEYSDIPLDVRTDSPNAAYAFATIPTTLISRDTLRYLGHSLDKVDSNNGGLEITFIDFITARLENYEDACEDDDHQWHHCLAACGVSGSVQDAIMDPRFNDIRLTNSCLFWVKDTLAMRYAGLEDISRASHQREMELAGARPCGSGGGDGSSGRGSGRGKGAQESPTKGGTSSQKRRSVSGLQQQTTPGISLRLWNSETAIELCNTPGYIVLFKITDQARIAGLFNDGGEVQSIEKLLSLPPSDFSGTRALFCFTPSYKVAEHYAAYAKRRANCESIVVVSLSIPEEVIANLEEPHIRRLHWPSPDWKQLVWHSRTTKSLPTPLRTYRDALLIIGTISKGAQRKYENFQTWEDMTAEACVLHVGSSNRSSPPEQYVFSGEEDGL
ncbi:hypothetical protein F4677DRAFT_459485 [Hypoxylon crocopeplum]|nr:hypothetical protein F4677DRAFT_459485 [Hypoxylon crocopeplum]